MFRVICSIPLDDNWEATSKEVLRLAGVRSNIMEAGCKNGVTHMEHVWLIAEFIDAVALRKRVETVLGTVVTIREE